jgi:hypothetical protein
MMRYRMPNNAVRVVPELVVAVQSAQSQPETEFLSALYVSQTQVGPVIDCNAAKERPAEQNVIMWLLFCGCYCQLLLATVE